MELLIVYVPKVTHEEISEEWVLLRTTYRLYFSQLPHLVPHPHTDKISGSDD